MLTWMTALITAICVTLLMVPGLLVPLMASVNQQATPSAPSTAPMTVANINML